MAGLRVVHVIEQLRPGGPLVALVGAAKNADADAPQEHRVVSLLSADSRACRHSGQAGIDVVSAPSSGELRRELALADIVQVHFWNSPVIHAWMATELPPLRVLAWCHVNGIHAPHILPRALLEFADVVAMTSPRSLDLPVFAAAPPGRTEFVFAGADFSRIEGIAPAAHQGVNVGYIGLVDFVKLHPAFVRMSAAVGLPYVRFLVCGGGNSRKDLQREAISLDAIDRFEFFDHVEEIRPLLSRLDIFGYPLCPETSATSELALQEAMYAGLPPVVFPHGGLDGLVTHARNGLVVATEIEYAQAIEFLCRRPEERLRLGANAAADARSLFGARRTASGMRSIYSRLMQLPKRPRTPGNSPTLEARPAAGAVALLLSLDGIGDADLMASLTADAAEASAAEVRIAAAGPNLRNVILQYRFRYADDPHLRLWSGLLLAAAGRPALAASEFKASLELGLDHPRVRHYFSAVASPPCPQGLP